MIRFPSSSAEILLFFLVSIYLFNVLQYFRFWFNLKKYQNKTMKELIKNLPMSPTDFFENVIYFNLFLFMIVGLIEQLVNGVSKTIFFETFLTYVFYIFVFGTLKRNEFLTGSEESLTKISYNFFKITVLSIALIAVSLIQLKFI